MEIYIIFRASRKHLYRQQPQIKSKDIYLLQFALHRTISSTSFFSNSIYLSAITIFGNLSLFILLIWTCYVFLPIRIMICLSFLLHFRISGFYYFYSSHSSCLFLSQEISFIHSFYSLRSTEHDTLCQCRISRFKDNFFLLGWGLTKQHMLK